MDIFKFAEEYKADYYEQNTGRIYKCKDWIEQGRPEEGIKVIDSLDGSIIGYAKQKK